MAYNQLIKNLLLKENLKNCEVISDDKIKSEVLKKLALLDTKVGKANTADNSKNKKNQKRTP